MFKGLGEEARGVIGDVLENNGKVSVGKRLCHIWNVNGTHTKYNAKLLRFARRPETSGLRIGVLARQRTMGRTLR